VANFSVMQHKTVEYCDCHNSLYEMIHSQCR